MEPNQTLFQTFEWDLPADQNHYQRLLQILPNLHSIGINALWLPPACKAGNPSGNGYDIYDLYDLGEFDQKGTRATKWGPKEDLVALAQKAKSLSVDLYFDAVLNHRCGGDSKEGVMVVEVDPKDRTKELGKPFKAWSWVRFDFPGRGNRYSEVKYGWPQFNATDWDDATRKHGIFRFAQGGKAWQKDVSDEWGNGDFLLMNNLDYTNKALREDVNNWGVWAVEQLGLAGFRLDALQHFSHDFSNNWMRHVQGRSGRKLRFIGEYWNGDVGVLLKWLRDSPTDLCMYDAPLLYNLARTSWSKQPDLRKVFDKTLVSVKPDNAVTLVMNHDTQPGQVMDTPIAPDFYMLAYTLILLREAGYPCVFYGDMFGISPPHPSPPRSNGRLADIILARNLYAYGEQVDYFTSKSCIGWVRKGVESGTGSKAAGMAVVMSWAPDVRAILSTETSSSKPGWFRRHSSALDELRGMWTAKNISQRMNVGKHHAGEIWSNLLEKNSSRVTINREGYGTFPCRRNNVAIFVAEGVEGRGRFPVDFPHMSSAEPSAGYTMGPHDSS